MGSVSIIPDIDLSLANIWQGWFKFRRGKVKTPELEIFTYSLEENLRQLYFDLVSGRYHHGGYRKFIVTDNKRREISVASIKDRVVHRLLYEYLTRIYDKTFIDDVWSCRKGKGLLGAILRTQKFLRRYSNSFVWRADIRKFFDHVDHNTLLRVLSLRINGIAFNLLKEVIESYSISVATRERERERVNARWSKECRLAI